jgi:hypothetical protein
LTGAEAEVLELMRCVCRDGAHRIAGGLATLGDDIFALLCRVQRHVDSSRDARFDAIEQQLRAAFYDINDLLECAQTQSALFATIEFDGVEEPA